MRIFCFLGRRSHKSKVPYEVPSGCAATALLPVPNAMNNVLQDPEIKHDAFDACMLSMLSLGVVKGRKCVSVSLQRRFELACRETFLLLDRCFEMQKDS